MTELGTTVLAGTLGQGANTPHPMDTLTFSFPSSVLWVLRLLGSAKCRCHAQRNNEHRYITDNHREVR